MLEWIVGVGMGGLDIWVVVVCECVVCGEWCMVVVGVGMWCLWEWVGRCGYWDG